MLFDGFWLEGEYFVPTLVLEVWGGPTRSPFHLEWSTAISRYNTEPSVFWGWAETIEAGEIDTTFLISHHAPLEDAAEMYRHWHDEQNNYTKIVLKPDLPKGEILEVQEVEYADA